jgi:hypothetical protein
VKRPLRPAPTSEEKKAIRRTTWKVLAVSLCAGLVGTCARLTVVRTAGAMPHPRLPEQTLIEVGKLPPRGGVGR